MTQNVSAFGMILAHLGVGIVSSCSNMDRCILSRDKTLVHSPAAPGGFPVMSYRCEVCGKEPWVGKQVSFSHKRSSRRWLPNIQRVRVKHGSNSKRVRVCTSCIKAGKIEKA
jgi:large subunit ribosomal protein L28